MKERDKQLQEFVGHRLKPLQPNRFPSFDPLLVLVGNVSSMAVPERGL